MLVLLAALFEEQRIEWTAELIVGLFWIIVVLSVGMFSLLYFLIKRGAVSKVSSLFFLVPPVVAVEAHLLYGETLGMTAVLGMVLAAAGVYLVTRSR